MQTATSGADVAVPAAAPRRPSPPTLPRPPSTDIGVVLHRARRLLDGCGASYRNDLAAAFIGALVNEGVPRFSGSLPTSIQRAWGSRNFK